MSGPLLKPDLSGVSRMGYSDWLPVTVKPISDAERQAWLDSVKKVTPIENKDRRETEVIVSLLARCCNENYRRRERGQARTTHAGTVNGWGGPPRSQVSHARV